MIETGICFLDAVLVHCSRRFCLGSTMALRGAAVDRSGFMDDMNMDVDINPDSDYDADIGY